VKLSDRQPIIVADTGPLIRLAAAGLLDSLRSLNRRIVIVDRVEEEAVADRSKPFAREIADWIEKMGEAIQREETIEGQGIAKLREAEPTERNLGLLKRGARNSGERAVREFVELYDPKDADDAIIVYEDIDMHTLLSASQVPLTLMTTRAFARQMAEWHVNIDAVEMLDRILPGISLRPAIRSIVTPDFPGVK
jgi:hypothetical protein